MSDFSTTEVNLQDSIPLSIEISWYNGQVCTRQIYAKKSRKIYGK
jgi:hypothetical protein